MNNTTAIYYLNDVLHEIEEGPFNVCRVCREAGIDPSVVSRWRHGRVEPRMSSIDRLAEAHTRMLAELSITRSAMGRD
jgi:transcriptional regulator with XRE-family HTH domain